MIGGPVAVVLMVVTGLVLLGIGQDVGPGNPATWPAGERASVHKRPGPQEPDSRKCQVIDPAGDPERRSLDWAESTRSTNEVTVDCEWDAIFLTGAASAVTSAVTSAVQSPLVMAPIAMTIAGILLFFPRFTLALARLSNPRRRR